LLNEYSEENRSNTPDWILAWYMLTCLDAFNRAVREREAWFGRMDNGGCVLPRTEPIADDAQECDRSNVLSREDDE
jgi:hypothetical protein